MNTKLPNVTDATALIPTGIMMMSTALAMALNLHAGPRISANYSIPTDSISAGGSRSTSASYTNDDSAGDVAGISTAASPAETAKQGYIGQLYEVASVQLVASPTTVNENTTRQLTATATLDDGTATALLGTDLNWSVISGPIISISKSGLATAGSVYQDTAATVQGSYFGINGILGLTVINVGSDDLGIYANDGVPDTWQVQYFGQNNPLAAPTADASGTGQSNLFKYIAGLNPTDRNSRFVTTVGPVSGSHTITFSPRLTDRTYIVQYSTNLTNWQTLTSAATQDNGQTRTVTDLDNTTTRKFYRVVLSFP